MRWPVRQPKGIEAPGQKPHRTQLSHTGKLAHVGNNTASAAAAAASAVALQ